MAVAVLSTACGSGVLPSGRSSGHARSATLKVHIGLYGGPMGLDGTMALSDSPAGHENVTAVDMAGHRFAARTDPDGVATLRLRPGRYTVFSTYCGVGRHHVALTAGRQTRVRIDCPVP